MTRASSPKTGRFGTYERNQILILTATALMLGVFFYFQWHQRKHDVALGISSSGPVITVQLGGQGGPPEIYKLPRGATVADLIRAGGRGTWLAELEPAWRDLVLAEGMAVNLWRTPKGVVQLSVNRMNGRTMGLLLLRQDLNSASAEDLEALPGIGPKTAEAIVQDRQARGPFQSVDDLTRVKGIGKKTVAGLRYQIFAGEGQPGKSK